MIAGARPARASVDALNAFSRRGRSAPIARWQRDAPPVLALDVGDASRADVVLGSLAADAIRLLTGPERDKIRACGAPGCVLVFLGRHPRREWCSAACGNRARQARHYARTRIGYARCPPARPRDRTGEQIWTGARYISMRASRGMRNESANAAAKSTPAIIVVRTIAAGEEWPLSTSEKNIVASSATPIELPSCWIGVQRARRRADLVLRRRRG